MKTKRKALLLALCAVLLVAASVLGTMAYLTSTAEVKNTFTVGNVAITMDEKDVDNDTDTADNVNINGEVRDTKNSYKLLPGHEYTKDPVIRVTAGSENCYLFVKVDNQIAGIEKTDSTVASQMAAKGWVAVTGHDGIYVYVGTEPDATTPVAVSAGTNVPVFDKIVIDGAVNNTTLAGYANKTITVTAYAVQKDGFEGKTAAEIWTAAGFTTTTPVTPTEPTAPDTGDGE